jgi:phosphocarrier protein
VISRTITIPNRLGLHARAATRLVQCASAHQSDVTISRDDKTVNGKSIMGVLMLAAAQGVVITISVEGPDENLALGSLCELIESGFGEES